MWSHWGCRCGISKGGCVPGETRDHIYPFGRRTMLGFVEFCVILLFRETKTFSMCIPEILLLSIASRAGREMQQPTDMGICFVTGSFGKRECWFSYEKKEKKLLVLSLIFFIRLASFPLEGCTFFWGEAGTGELFWSFSMFKMYSFLMWFFF